MLFARLNKSGEAYCIGYNANGQLGNGTTDTPQTSFVRYGGTLSTIPTFVALGDGTGSRIRALDTAGNVYCSGMGCGAGTPTIEATGVEAFWGDTFGDLHTSDAVPTAGNTCRVANGRASYQVTAAGIVDGARLEDESTSEEGDCTLDEDGVFTCAAQGDFGGRSILAIGSSPYADYLSYGVTYDGAIYLDDGTEYAPAGTAQVPVCTYNGK